MSETPNYWTLLVNKFSRAARAKVTFRTSFRRSAVLPLVKLPRILKNLSRQAHTQSNGADVD